MNKDGMITSKTDVLIIGGGPAGSTIGTLLKKNGWDVTLLEKDRHPRFHIGESLLPMNLPIFERLGVLDEIEDIGVPKLGADFTVGNSGSLEKTFYFKNALGDSPGHAFEVRRSEFDRVLFHHCQRAGVQAIEGMKVRSVTAVDGGSHEVEAVDENGVTYGWETRFLVDASGRDTFLSSANGWKRTSSKHAGAAVFGHFRAVERRIGDDQGNISLYWFEHGWIWMIPLQDDIMSIGAVCNPKFLRTRSGSLDEYLLETLNGVEETRSRMAGAEVVVPARATGNYAYSSERMLGPGYLMIGDAFAFIDPVFSSGVYLAMNGAERGVAVAQAWLSGNRREYARACRRYERETSKGISTFAWFIYRFTSPAMTNLMSNPRNVLQVVQAVISMLAGDVYSNRRIRRRLMVFKTIYWASWLLNWRASLAARRLRLVGIRASSQVQD